MKKIFFYCVFLSATSIYAQSGFSYKDIAIENDNRTQADEAACIDKEGTIMLMLHGTDRGFNIRRYASDFKTYKYNNYPSVTGEPHEILALKNGGYALAGRNFFGIADAERNVTKSIGGKMLDWRANNNSDDGSTMALWKQNGAGTTGTAVDFVELAESPNGNYVCSLFLYHQWNGSNQPIMRLGLAISDLTQGGKMTIHDLNLEQSGATSQESVLEAAMQVEMACLDDSHVLIGLDNASEANEYERRGNEFVVVNFAQIAAGSPLNAEVWHGKLYQFEKGETFINGFFVDTDGNVYFAMGGTNDNLLVGKAVWDGTQLSVKNKQEKTGFTSYGPDIVANMSDDYFVLAGRSYTSTPSLSGQPYFLKVKKSDLSFGSTQIIPGTTTETHRANCAILDVHALDPETIAVFLRGNFQDNTRPGSFIHMTVTLGN
jgi:hypothetical protein